MAPGDDSALLPAAPALEEVPQLPLVPSSDCSAAALLSAVSSTAVTVGMDPMSALPSVMTMPLACPECMPLAEVQCAYGTLGVRLSGDSAVSTEAV